MSKIILKAKGIVKTYNPESVKPVRALRGIGVKLKEGEFVVLDEVSH